MSHENEHSLDHLRQQIKKIMIPMLIKIFELKLSAQQSKNLPSRLQKFNEESADHVRQQLTSMQENLKLLELWNQSCQNQIAKALREINSPLEPSFRPICSDQKSHPAVKKSFSEAVANQANVFKKEAISIQKNEKKTWKQKFKLIFDRKKI